MNAVKKLKFNSSSMASLIVLIVLIVLLSIISPNFLKAANLINVMQQVTVNALIAIGMMTVILTSGIDLSVGSVMAISGYVMGTLIINMGVNTFFSVCIGLLIGVGFGALNGILVAKCRLQPMIATLGTMQIARGLTLTMAQGRTISGFTPTFRWIGTTELAGIPLQVLLMILLYILMFYVLKYRKFGRYVYSIGGNEEATRLSGINVNRYKIAAYTISGLMSAIAAIVYCAKLNSAVPTAGDGYELDAIASTVIGGTSLLGGSGSIWGTLFGAIIIGVIKNGLNLMNVSSYLQKVVIGVILLVAVLVDSFRAQSSSRKK